MRALLRAWVVAGSVLVASGAAASPRAPKAPPTPAPAPAPGNAATAAPEPPAAPAVPSTVVGKGAFAARLTTRPARIVLGRTGAVVFHIEAPEPPGALRPLRASVNVGTLGAVKRLSPGEYEVAYTPPKPRYPQVAIVAVWFETGADAPVAFFRVSLLGLARVPLRTVPRAKITADVAGHTFGPFRASRHGRAVLRLVVPPGVPQATITAQNRYGRRTSRTLNLPVPPYNRLTLALVPHTIVADGVSRARLHLYFDAVGGRTPTPKQFEVTAKVGTVGRIRHDSGPVFDATYTAPPGTPDQTVAFHAGVNGQAKSHAMARISLGRQTPARVAVGLTPKRFIADGRTRVEVSVTVLDALGLGVPKLHPMVTIGSGKPVPAREVGKGVYETAFTPKGLGPEASPKTLTVTATVGKLSGRGEVAMAPYKPARLLVAPTKVSLTADGDSAVVLHVRVLDTAGRPMADLAPTVHAHLGTVATPARDGHGAWEVRYRVPRIAVKVAGASQGPQGSEADTVTLQAGALTRTVDVHLSPALLVLPPPHGFVEVAGGYRTNFGRLKGPQGTVAFGVKIAGSATAPVTLGVTAGGGDAQGSYALAGGGTARTTLVVTPLLLDVRISLRSIHWLFSAGAGAGAVLLFGNARLPASADIPIHDTLIGAAGRLEGGRRIGHGYLFLEASYLYATPPSKTVASSGGVAVTGPVGGLALALGYRLEL